MSGVVSRPTAT